MQILVVGLNHKTSPVALLERLSIAQQDHPKALDSLMGYGDIAEGTILSTCNRTEVYAVVSRFHAGVQDVRNFLAEFCHVTPEDLTVGLYDYHGEAAVRHLFRVAAGLDSMVVGESEILGQVRGAFVAAKEQGAAGPLLSELFPRALHAGKRARRETSIGKRAASLVSAALEMARVTLDRPDLSGLAAVVVGAGHMGSSIAAAASQAGAAAVTIVNRDPERGRAVATRVDGRYRGFDEIAQALAEADVVFASTGSPDISIDTASVAEAVQGRTAPLLFIDLAVPRDVDPLVAELDGVILRDIDDLREVAPDSPVGEVLAVEKLLDEEVARFSSWERTIEVAPVMAALVARGEAIRQEELDRAAGALKGLTEAERAAVERVTARIVAKLLHEPLQAARSSDPDGGGAVHLQALRSLIDRES